MCNFNKQSLDNIKIIKIIKEFLYKNILKV